MWACLHTLSQDEEAHLRRILQSELDKVKTGLVETKRGVVEEVTEVCTWTAIDGKVSFQFSPPQVNFCRSIGRLFQHRWICCLCLFQNYLTTIHPSVKELAAENRALEKVGVGLLNIQLSNTSRDTTQMKTDLCWIHFCSTGNHFEQISSWRVGNFNQATCSHNSKTAPRIFNQESTTNYVSWCVPRSAKVSSPCLSFEKEKKAFKIGQIRRYHTHGAHFILVLSDANLMQTWCWTSRQSLGCLCETIFHSTHFQRTRKSQKMCRPSQSLYGAAVFEPKETQKSRILVYSCESFSRAGIQALNAKINTLNLSQIVLKVSIEACGV